VEIVRIVRTPPDLVALLRGLAFAALGYCATLIALVVIPHDDAFILGLPILIAFTAVAGALSTRRLPRLELSNRPLRYSWPAMIASFWSVWLLLSATRDVAWVAGIPLLIAGYFLSDALWIRATQKRRRAVAS
jgi:hypothetical protein